MAPTEEEISKRVEDAVVEERRMLLAETTIKEVKAKTEQHAALLAEIKPKVDKIDSLDGKVDQLLAREPPSKASFDVWLARITGILILCGMVIGGIIAVNSRLQPPTTASGTILPSKTP